MYLIQLCTTGIIPYKCVIYTAWRGTNHSLIPHNHVPYAVSSPVRQHASSISYATASHTKWMVTRPVRWDVRIIATLWTPFSFIHSFNQINWVSFVGDVFLSLPKLQSDFWSDLQLIFGISILAFCRVSYAIFCYTVVYVAWYAVWFDPYFVIAHWITMRTPRIAYENASRTGVPILRIIPNITVVLPKILGLTRETRWKVAVNIADSTSLMERTSTL